MNRYEEYIEAHAEEIAQLVNQDFENNKDELKIKVLHIIWDIFILFRLIISGSAMVVLMIFPEN